MRQHWQKTETKNAKSLGARQTPRSGGLWFAKGDSATWQHVIDSKQTKTERYSITTDVWEKISQEALTGGKKPVLYLNIGKKQVELVVLDANDFIELIEKETYGTNTSELL